MQELKFKAFIKSLHIIAEVRRINFDCQTVEVDLSNGEADLVEYNFDEVILMQYTGLRDMNNKEVYENNVIEVYEFHNGEYISGGIGVVEYIYAEASYGVGSYPLQWYLEDTATEQPKAYFKVLGNIYDNKELINKLTLKNPYSDLEFVKQ